MEWRGAPQKENKEKKADATSKREGVKESRWEDRQHKTFEDSSTFIEEGCGGICGAATGLRIILLFRGYKVLEVEIVSLMPSQVSQRCVPV